MIDTIVYTCFLALLSEDRWLKGWQGWWPKGRDGQPFQRYENYLKHSPLGIRLSIRAGTVVKVEVDLPKLLYGHNGRLLKTQAELDRAFVRLKLALQTICVEAAPGHGYHPGDIEGDLQTHFTRIDLVWQFDLAPAFVFGALRNAKHPEIHKAKGEWQDQTLVFPGTKLRIIIYDKAAKERAKCSHDVLRFEVQLHGEKIDQHFAVAENNVLTRLPIDRAYAAYRSVLLGFGSGLVPKPDGEGTIEDFLAWVVTKLPDSDPVGVYCQTKGICPRTSKTLRKEVGLRVPQ